MSDKTSIAKAYESGLFTQKEIAEKVKKSQSYVSNIISDVKKDQEIEELKNALAEKDRELDYVKIQRDNIHKELELMQFTMFSKTGTFTQKKAEIEDKTFEIEEAEIVK
ncbi:MAG: hypothetical protein HUJ87_16480 [Fusobacterium varium]|uniref:hypothetical protein n=1 Tax=Fusobacterium varium TaxID=856 RepID=UPI0024323846|nr:hypothetical protein [Fusobacterium varium]MCF0172088.1 hypothetical protein [Fusobacterium varium]MCF0209704.1 hypothetical protein [Bacteroidales bacterium]